MTARPAKTASKVSYHKKPKDLSTEMWQRELRKAFVADVKKKPPFVIAYVEGEQGVFGDYSVKNTESGNTYKVALHGREPGLNFCTCMDFKTNMLGTCKHIEAVLLSVVRNAKKAKLLAQRYRPAHSSLYVKYGAVREVMIRIGEHRAEEFEKLAKKYFDHSYRLRPDALDRIDHFLAKAAAISSDFRCYPDAMDFLINARETKARLAVLDRRVKTAKNRYFDKLLKTQLYPYQKEGILFAARAGRSLIADEMGLGKTLQAIGLAELLKKEFGIRRVLIVCPTSLKYQWKSEIERFTHKSNAQVIEGNMLARHKKYGADYFYTIASYNVVGADLDAIQSQEPDLVILDEAQRIKNWQTKTAREVKKIRSKYALVLTGTPIENKLEELYSIVQFIDPFALGPLYRFLEKHQTLDESGKVVGYRDLHDIRRILSDIVLRRTKASVAQQLPGRTDKNLFVPMTEMQADMHAEFADKVARLVKKWKRLGFLDEADRQRLLRALNCMRMLADSTYILDQETRHDTKIAELMCIIDDLVASGSEKAVVFSQWERMTRLVARELENRGAQFAYLHGGIPSDKRKGLLDEFRENPLCRVFLSTDAGGVGLNLQSASLIVNIDLPWNPAVLEQRIGRIHRHGQKRSVNVINLISRDSIEHRMLDVLKFKSSLFAGALDGGEDQVFMGESKFKRFMSSVEKVADTSATDTKETVITDAEERDQDTRCETADASPAQESALVRLPVDPDDAAKTDVSAHTHAPAPDAVSAAHGFLAALADTFADPRKTEQLMSSFVKTDEQAGTRRIVIPPDIEHAALRALDAFAEMARNANAR